MRIEFLQFNGLLIPTTYILKALSNIPYNIKISEVLMVIRVSIIGRIKVFLMISCRCRKTKISHVLYLSISSHFFYLLSIEVIWSSVGWYEYVVFIIKSLLLEWMTIPLDSPYHKIIDSVIPHFSWRTHDL